MPIAKKSSAVFWQGLKGDVNLYLGDAKQVLRKLPAQSVHCVVTSPPYWNQRQYTNGDRRLLEIGNEPLPDCDTHGQAQCGRCFICALVAVFRDVRRVLRDDGTLWLNLGSSYFPGGGGKRPLYWTGDLVPIPWLSAVALQHDGWILRQDIIYSKVGATPESANNRCTKSHEYVFLLAKHPDYYYDNFAVRESGKATMQRIGGEGLTANKRSVWTVSASGNYEGSHFATFPPKLIEPCILAGVPERVCERCGNPHLRQLDREKLFQPTNGQAKWQSGMSDGINTAHRVLGVSLRQIGWQPTCDCGAATIPGTVLDCFLGSGTTAEVALLNNRRVIGIDLSEEYLRNNAIPRIEGVCHGTPELAARLGGPRVALSGSSLAQTKTPVRLGPG